MYPKLTDLIREVFGVNIPLPVQTYGLFVALAFLSGIWIFSIEFKRREREGILHAVKKTVIEGKPASPLSLIISGLIGFIIGYKLLAILIPPGYSELVNNPQEFIMSSKGNIFGGIIGAALSAFMTYRDKNKKKLETPVKVTKTIRPHELSGNILVVAGVFGLLGAKVFAILESPMNFINDPIGELTSFSGLTFLGGLIMGTAAVYFYVKRYNIKGSVLFDTAAVVMPLAYAIGRMGCQLSGDGCWGIENTMPQPDWLAWLPEWTWSFDYPHNVNKDSGRILIDGIWKSAHPNIIEGCNKEIWQGHCYRLATPVFPTPLYESSIMLAIFGIISFIKYRVKIGGILFSIYLILGGLERFFVESIRVNVEYHVGSFSFTQAEMLSMLMILAGVALAIYFLRNKDKFLYKKV